MRRVLAGLLVLGTVASVQAQEAPVLRYQLDVIAQGSRSQGLRGALFDAGGAPVTPATNGTLAETDFGSFQYVECQHGWTWSICGWLEVGTVEAMPMAGINTTFDGASRFRVVALDRDGATVYRGELLLGEAEVAMQETSVTNPMGVFVPVAPGGVFEGWRPEIWPQSPSGN